MMATKPPRLVPTLALGSLAALVIIVGAILLQSALTAADKSTQPKITWSQDQINVALPPGMSATKEVSFSSSLSLKDVAVEPVSNIANFVVVQPRTFPTIAAGSMQSVRITFSVPDTASFGTNEGTVHIRVGIQTLPQTLKVSLWRISVEDLKLSLSSLQRRSDLIVLGSIASMRTGADEHGHLNTYLNFIPSRVLKGSVSNSNIVVRSPGGIIGNYSQALLGSLPNFMEGQTLLLVLHGPKNGEYQTQYYGVFHIENDPEKGAIAVIDPAYNSEGEGRGLVYSDQFKMAIMMSAERSLTLSELMAAFGVGP